ncbi:tubulinyl-Tyr carboxypeptidase [Marchantia polymorpha subsp. ruderalis]|uniref:Vasohibin-2 n=2 Tax=Marchantia polymorpha TaxID=3197 RepID=A0AAF6AKL6_MARPO|nr:hypothetical protein MARPO_0029s0039 [Marchantia polymorpha]PTQ42497.1 hypothetical protein MARPO_0029s0039 [Marchantia polymorpha]BBM96985.1 hypothetical protein Mp_1g02080 [Marchantia polymorpha subsp. ruderalis]BBM96986.1 hypothetical protein Mp_1g02080 [Marchantia polymorpha subsp. ruderalis]|eukprot:PTQ42496.1 hypothetical protein MARPO_0029s0039 [Marchantia polymorpha]
MDAVSAALEDYYNQAESPPMSPTSMSAMASAADTNCNYLSRAETTPGFTGLRSLHALSGHSEPTANSERVQQKPGEAVLMNRVMNTRDAVAVENTGEPSLSDKKEPCSTKIQKPTIPENFSRLVPRSKLKAVKQFLSSFEYKQTPATHFNTHKLRPLTRIMDTARMIIYSPQPIKCVEAVFLALYLTAGIPDCDRTPLGFKTSLNGQVFQHIVLLVQYGGKFGAFGISRQADLMNKDLTFNSISDIVGNYKAAYEASGHTILKIRVGLPVEHRIQSPNYVCWRHLSLSPGTQSWEQCCEALENHVLKKNRLWDLWLLVGKGGDPRRKSLDRKAALDTKALVKDGMKKKKKVRTQDTTMKAFAEREQVVTKREVRRDSGSVPSPSSYAEAKASKERKRGASLAATKSLMKTRLLQSKTSFLIRQSVEYVGPKLFSYRTIPHSRGSLSISQTKRHSRVSFNIDDRKKDIPSKGKGKRNNKLVKDASRKARN